MLNTSFLGCLIKVLLWDLTFCIVEIEEKSHSDIDLDPTMLNSELVRAISIYHNIFKFHVPCHNSM